ncbi:hypothetical protein R1T16_09470 [Flavobacterium sp. DG1-102-2]|uniref:hypothetical protein n=1 Tax=Flavobacterium sp. DG1-102-2 TaxID=3081663 RepID=UPI002949582C|nr:hypothetical protein [Flavobacterium sp. DG1-102-2]MDV6168652.1 hypothetical protein [Flavobacterium sp. DG1-102-2]
MIQRITTLFAIVGVTLLAANIYSFFRHQSITSQYWENCKKVKPGMTLEQARTIIGDIGYQNSTQDDRSGEIIINKQSDGTVEYRLEYDMVFAGSDSPKIYFDPKTLSVIKVQEGE